jgi:adenine deaminase
MNIPTRADLLLTEATILDVFGGRLLEQSLAIAGGRVIGFGDCEADRVVPLRGKILLPGFCDGHLHLESSMICPAQFAAAAVPHGTTSVVADPHEIANVCGLAGPRYLLDSLPEGFLDLFVMAPTCVPATSFETSGAVLGPAEIAEMLAWPGVLGLGEVMNYPGVIHGDPDLLAKLALAGERPIDGHAPGLGGADLAQYVAAGPDSDHECTCLVEAQEKLAAGMWVMIREGSAARNLAALSPLLSGPGASRCLLVSDDLEPGDLLERGHVDHLLREAVRLGADPVAAVRAVTINAASRFGLRHRGALAPGYLADVVAVDDLQSFNVAMVIKGGTVVAQAGRLTRDMPASAPGLTDTCHVPALAAERLRLPAPAAGRRVTARVIVATDGEIVTGQKQAVLRVCDGAVGADVDGDVLRLAVIERHGRNGNIGLGVVSGFGLTCGALASTVAHDSHNLIVVGCDEASMLTAARAVAEVGGGQAVAVGEEILALLPLPIAGLIGVGTAAEVAGQARELAAAAGRLGCRLTRPFMTLSFMALPVIPHLKLTDQGLFDVSEFRHVPVVG